MVERIKGAETELGKHTLERKFCSGIWTLAHCCTGSAHRRNIVAALLTYDDSSVWCELAKHGIAGALA